MNKSDILFTVAIGCAIGAMVCLSHGKMDLGMGLVGVAIFFDVWGLFEAQKEVVK